LLRSTLILLLIISPYWIPCPFVLRCIGHQVFCHKSHIWLKLDVPGIMSLPRQLIVERNQNRCWSYSIPSIS
jgi:hypothetical protein